MNEGNNFNGSGESLIRPNNLVINVEPQLLSSFSNHKSEVNNDFQNFNRCAPSFGPPKEFVEISDVNDIKCKLNLNSRLDGGFFKHDDIWTCYRRNYFRCLSSLSFFRNDHLVDPAESLFLWEKSAKRIVKEFTVELSSNSNGSNKKPTELVMHTAKRAKATKIGPHSAKIIVSDGLTSKTPMSGIEFSSRQDEHALFSRLQFKSATANNGRRKCIQQFFAVSIELFAILDDDSKVRIASSETEPIVVRGRSPGHYADARHKDSLKERNIQAMKRNRNFSNLMSQPLQSPLRIRPTHIGPKGSLSAIAPNNNNNRQSMFPFSPVALNNFDNDDNLSVYLSMHSGDEYSPLPSANSMCSYGSHDYGADQFHENKNEFVNVWRNLTEEAQFSDAYLGEQKGCTFFFGENFMEPYNSKERYLN